MSLYAQHGHAKSDRIETALSANVLDGVIFGARNENPEKLKEYITHLHSDFDVDLLFDPHFYICALPQPKTIKLNKYDYFPGELTRRDFIGSRKLVNFAKSITDEQINLGLDGVISPTVIFDSFEDRWFEIALNLADACIEYHSALDGPPRLILNFAFSEEALNSREGVDEFLNQVTAWENIGSIYLLVSRSDPTYSQQIDELRLQNLMYLIYVLGKLNNIEVICGYSDYVGLILRAVGASTFATGWYHKLRQFHKNSFVVQPDGGQPPSPRYSSTKLFNSILLSELELIGDIGELEQVLSNTSQDTIITSAPTPTGSDWTIQISEQQHWEALASLNSEITGDVSVDLQDLNEKILNAQALYTHLLSEHVLFERITSREYHLPSYLNAIRAFEDELAQNS